MRHILDVLAIATLQDARERLLRALPAEDARKLFDWAFAMFDRFDAEITRPGVTKPQRLDVVRFVLHQMAAQRVDESYVHIVMAAGAEWIEQKAAPGVST